MENPYARNIVSIRFTKIGKLYNFDASHLEDVKVGDWVVVETSRGWQLGEVAQLLGEVSSAEEGAWKKIDRKATAEDLLHRKSLESKEEELLTLSKKSVIDHKLEGVKIVSVELSLDATRVTILYSFESENKIDLRFIKYDIGRVIRNAQVDLRQIGPRDVAKIFGGMGACGLPTRCCSKFLTDFSSISIRMAKEQGISLTPAEITGMCGRLRCCLIYEYEVYAENRRLLPKRNKRVMTPVGEGKVVDLLPLKLAVIVDLPQVGRREFNNADIELYDPAIHDQLKPVQPVEPERTVSIESTPTKPVSPPRPANDANRKPESNERSSSDSRNRRPKRRKRRPGSRENQE